MVLKVLFVEISGKASVKINKYMMAVKKLMLYPQKKAFLLEIKTSTMKAKFYFSLSTKFGL